MRCIKLLRNVTLLFGSPGLLACVSPYQHKMVTEDTFNVEATAAIGQEYNHS